jgi:glucosamine--fructose-6-phosphate aminotransferase (isomerizing)
MCGIVACRTAEPALDYILPALEHLEYRGYDSAGVAISTADGSLALLRSVGKLNALKKMVAGYSGPILNGTGIGHTRWATHGEVSERNAHPHLSCGDRVAIVHNGIIDNAAALRSELRASKHIFRSDVDSEVVAHLVEHHLRAGEDLMTAVAQAGQRLSGSWAIAVLERGTGRIVVSAHRCPLVVARSPHGTFAASDVAALLRWVDTAHVLRDDDVVELGPEWRWAGPEGPRSAPPAIKPDWRPDEVMLGAHRDFMAKEIAEQPAVAARIIDELVPGVADGSLWGDLHLPAPERIHLLACGTSLHAGMVIGRVFEMAGGVPVRTVVASEAAESVVEPGALVLAISQSGETADVLQALDQTGAQPVLALTNTMHSTLARRADAAVNCYAGPEIGVAATKTFTAQVLTGTALALSGLVCGGQLTPAEAGRYLAQLAAVPERLAAAEQVAAREVPALAEALAPASGFLFLARGAGVPYAAEGALKLQELTYRWAHAYPAGELKHGPIALLEQGTPVIAIDDGNRRLRANLSEVAARGARVIDIGGPGSRLPLLDRHQPAPPWGPLECVLALQHLARSIALELGRDVDKPRNLAKSVTVE